MITRTSPRRVADHGLDRDARHAGHARIARIRQQVAIHLPHRQPRQDHVAEAAPAAVVARLVDGHAGDRRVAGQQLREALELVLAVAAAEPRVGIVVGDLLQAQHVEIGEARASRDDARRIDAWSTPRHHCTFQVMSFIADSLLHKKCGARNRRDNAARSHRRMAGVSGCRRA